jgi:hypothetical protein
VRWFLFQGSFKLFFESVEPRDGNAFNVRISGIVLFVVLMVNLRLPENIQWFDLSGDL